MVSHEACHLFGLVHCTYFQCSMNESTSLQEALSQPLFLCLVCLSKVQRVCKFELLGRYRKLHAICSGICDIYPTDYLTDAVEWLDKTILHLMQLQEDIR